MANNWGSYNKKKSDTEKSLAIATELTKDIPEKPDNVLIKTGQKRKVHGKTNRPPFPGTSIEDSDKLRMIVGMKFNGFTLAESFDRAGINPSSGPGWVAARQDAYNMAEHELMELALRGYQSNLWIMRTALSELGPRAVRTLGEIMEDKRESGNTRLKAATAVLKMVDVDHSATGGAQEGLAKELADGIKGALADIRSGKIVDAEDAEVVEDGNDGDSIALQ